MPKRKSASGETEYGPKSKRSKLDTGSSKTPKQMKDEEGNPYWLISDKRRLTISTFKNQSFVDLREFYEKDGKLLPGKQGIALKVEQFVTLLSALPNVVDVLKSKGFEVPDVSLGHAGAQEVVDENENGEEEEANGGSERENDSHEESEA